MIARKLIQKSLILSHLKSSYRLQKRTCTYKPAKTYEGDGKTSVQVLNNDIENGILINGISQAGFRLNNELFIVGPMIIFPRSVLSWNIENYKDIDEKSLCIFNLLDPKIEILVLGIGDQQPTAEFQRKILAFMRKHKINVEVLQTEQACATFNFLNSEARMVAGAMIPPATLSVSEDDYAKYLLERQNILSLDS